MIGILCMFACGLGIFCGFFGFITSLFTEPTEGGGFRPKESGFGRLIKKIYDPHATTDIGFCIYSAGFGTMIVSILFLIVVFIVTAIGVTNSLYEISDRMITMFQFFLTVRGVLFTLGGGAMVVLTYFLFLKFPSVVGATFILGLLACATWSIGVAMYQTPFHAPEFDWRVFGEIIKVIGTLLGTMLATFLTYRFISRLHFYRKFCLIQNIK